MAPKRPSVFFAAEDPKSWKELCAEELERGNFTRAQLTAWTKACGLEPGTPVVWLMPRAQARELARHYGRDDAEPRRFSSEDVVLLEPTRGEEPGWVLARVKPRPAEEPLVVEPPVELRAWSMEEALKKGEGVEMLCFYGGEPLTPDVARFERVRIVELDGAPLPVLPEEVFGLPGLESLSVAGTALSELPSALKRVKTLKRLEIVHNALTALPEWLEELPRLTELCVDPSVLGGKGEGLMLVARLPALRRLDVLCRDRRPKWLVPFGGFTEVRVPNPRCASFVRLG